MHVSSILLHPLPTCLCLTLRPLFWKTGLITCLAGLLGGLDVLTPAPVNDQTVLGIPSVFFIKTYPGAEGRKSASLQSRGCVTQPN